MRKEALFKGLVAGFVLILGLALAFSSPARAEEWGRDILVGGTAALTGPFSGSAKIYSELHDNFAAMINERGGILLKETGKRHKLRFITYDDKSDKTAARKFYERLVTVDKVDVLIGPYSSPITVGASSVGEKHKVPFVCVEANATAIYGRGFKWIVGVLASGELWSDHYFDLLKSEGKAKTIAFVTEDNLHALDVYRGAIKKAKKEGLKVLVDKVRVPSKTTDFTPIITEIKAKDPDIVFVSSFIPFGIAFLKQAKELDLNPREFHIIHHGGGFLNAVGKDGEYVTGEVYWVPGMQFGDTKFFDELLRRTKTSVQAYPWTAIRVPAMDVIVDALKRAGSLDKAKVMKALKKTNLETVGGVIRFSADGSGTMNSIPTQIQGGKHVLIAPRAQGYPAKAHLYPTPPWRERK